MSNNTILISQKRHYMNLRNLGKSQIEAANCCNISERTARRIDKNGITQNSSGRNWQTRVSPLQEVWSELESLLESAPNLQPRTLFDYLEDKYPGQYGGATLRTLQRKVKDWKVLKGNDKEVMFLQKHQAGAMGISDFTILTGITIGGDDFNHRLYHYRLVFSKWAYVKIIMGGESYTALTEGLQNALIKSGGTPKEHRSDSLSAAFNNNKKEFTACYEQFCDHYNIKPTRCNLGKSHENGAIESPHGHLKNKIRQALLLRGSNDFLSIEEYQFFIDQIVARHNKRCHLFAEEKKCLGKLPQHKTADFTVLHVKVTSCSTINVRSIAYSVPSRLIAQKLIIHLFDDRLEIFYNSKKIYELRRIYNKDKRRSCINYRHIITSLVQKPQAFKNFRYKEDLFPSDFYKNIWQVASKKESKLACKYFVKLLFLASKLSEIREDDLANYVIEYHGKWQELPSIEKCSSQFGITTNYKKIPIILTYQHPLSNYNQLLQ